MSRDQHTDNAAIAVAALEAVLDHGAGTDDEVLDALDRWAAPIIAIDLAHRMVPHANRLSMLDVRGRPWAALLVGISVCSIDQPRGLELLIRAHANFGDRNDVPGIGYAALLIGNEFIATGDFETAGSWWRQAREHLDEDNPGELIAAAHGSLTHYQTGDLVEAQRRAESVLQRAQRTGNSHAEGIAAVYIAFFCWWSGNFRRVDAAAAEADVALSRIPDENNRYELPLVHAARGMVAGLRGDAGALEQEFDAGIASARHMQNLWYEAILHTMRSEAAAEWHPQRSIDDARSALDYFEQTGEHWWSNWARQAVANAYRVAGYFHASAEIIDQLLATDLSPLEHGRALLAHGDIAAALGDAGTARDSYRAARSLFEPRRADYCTSRAEIGLAVTDLGRSTYWHRAAITRAGTESTDPAWARILRGPATIDAQLLGVPSVRVNGHPVHFATSAALRTFARLALATPSGLHVETLIDEFWPEQPVARANHSLDNLVSQLRRALLPSLRLERRGRILRMNIDPSECDALRVVQCARAVLAQPARATPIDELEALHSQLGKALLGGGFAEWIIEAQQELDALRDQILTRIRHHTHSPSSIVSASDGP